MTPEHGTINRYQHWACKCDQCTEVGRAYTRSRVIARSASVPEHLHGKRSTYVNYACRCGPCVEVNSAYLRRRRLQQ